MPRYLLTGTSKPRKQASREARYQGVQPKCLGAGYVRTSCSIRWRGWGSGASFVCRRPRWGPTRDGGRTRPARRDKSDRLLAGDARNLPSAPTRHVAGAPGVVDVASAANRGWQLGHFINPVLEDWL